MIDPVALILDWEYKVHCGAIFPNYTFLETQLAASCFNEDVFWQTKWPLAAFQTNFYIEREAITIYWIWLMNNSVDPLQNIIP